MKQPVLTQRDLAEKSGVPQSTIARIEQGANTSISTLCKIAFALDKQVKISHSIDKMQAALNTELDTGIEGSRMYQLSRNCIYGTDANPRMARTSKMNMIMHGDGHGGVHHHDGLLNINGIFEERFDVILTKSTFWSECG